MSVTSLEIKTILSFSPCFCAFQHSLCAIEPGPLPHLILALHVQRLNVPNGFSILIDAAITAEEAHARHARDALRKPLVLVLVRRIDEIMRCEVGMEVIRHKVVVAVINNSVDQSREGAFVTESAFLDGLENLGQIWVDLILAVEVVMAEILNVLRQIAEEEDILVSSLAGDLDL